MNFAILTGFMNFQVLLQAHFFSKGIPSLAKIALTPNISWITRAKVPFGFFIISHIKLMPIAKTKYHFLLGIKIVKIFKSVC